MKHAVLSMDIEDWYHLDYFDRSRCDQSRSLLDGLNVYRELLAREAVPSSFFVLGELAGALKSQLTQLAADGHDIGSHGWNHIRPLTLSAAEFSADVRRARSVLEDTLGRSVPGYRAPCFSLDRNRLELLWEAGHVYDSSRIRFSHHAIYGAIDMTGYQTVSRNIYRRDEFVEFQVSTLDIVGKTVPVAGGGYIRILPWWLMRRMLSRYLASNELYVLYIHPFELSRQPAPSAPRGTPHSNRVRFRVGRAAVYRRLQALIAMLRENSFAFTTFAALRDEIVAADSSRGR